MNWSLRRELIPIGVVVLFAVLTLTLWSGLPDQIPSHFDFKGNVDRYESKVSFAVTFAAITLVLYFILTFVPFIDPFWKRIKDRYNIFLILRDCMMVCMLAFYLVLILSAKSGHMSETGMGVAFGLVFVLFGNYMPRLPRNFFFGIRSPWTLASDEVWKRTHAVGGWLFVVAGLIIMICSLAGIKFGITMLVVLIPLVLFTGIAYPLYLYKKLQREHKLDAPKL
ncbi:MAG: SdpI family protein [Candidatus Zixiibacteriota bacterium]